LGLNSFQTSGNSPGVRRGQAPSHPRHPAPCRVGVLGFGSVGSAVAKRLTGPDSVSNLQLTHICDRRAREKRNREPESSAADVVWIDRFDDLLTSEVDIVVEAMSGTGPSVDYVRAALLTGKSVVTTNKQVMAHHGPGLLSLAERQGRQLRFEAAVGGAMPIVRALEGLAGDRITRVVAILNGTSNAVLSRMDQTGCDMDEAVADACARGYAEGDPAADLDGTDAAAKLAILCALAFRLRVGPAQIVTRSTAGLGQTDFREARQRSGTIRQIAHGEYDWTRSLLTAWVAPMLVPATSIFARATGPQNAAVLLGAHAGEVTISGAGAGSDAMAVAVVGDLIAIARDRAAIVPAPVLSEPEEIRGLPDQKLAEAV
jgi:homoserine dehydrogenase